MFNWLSSIKVFARFIGSSKAANEHLTVTR
jgi:hypothetical protein